MPALQASLFDLSQDQSPHQAPSTRNYASAMMDFLLSEGFVRRDPALDVPSRWTLRSLVKHGVEVEARFSAYQLEIIFSHQGGFFAVLTMRPDQNPWFFTHDRHPLEHPHDLAPLAAACAYAAQMAARLMAYVEALPSESRP